MEYRYLDHTSDLGVEIFGPDLPALFRNACFALFDNILNLEAIDPSETREIDLISATLDELFLDWLRELLFRFSTGYFVVRDIPRLEITGTTLRAEVRGERFDLKRHRIKTEIKTPTYHMFRIAHDREGYRATVIFDV